MVHAALARHGRVAEHDGWFVVDGVDAESVPDLVAEVVSNGARVYAVEPVRQTLEERFLTLIETERARWQH
jgi:cell division FtsZ-interacting protein ZapD